MEHVNPDFHSYKISNKGHLRLLSSSLFYLGAYLVCSFAALIFYAGDSSIFAIFVGAILLLVFTGPAYYLHYKYFLRSQHQELRLHKNFMEIFENGLLKFTISKKDIQRIQIFMSPAYIAYGTTSGMPFHEHNYMEIETSNTTVQINNLLFPDLKYLAQNFFDTKPIYHESYFANIQ
ncbi:hypothetical protein [Pedobacter sp. UYP1]|jgi:hypothetical protein|uniref:hypothetical protein n=1 Tax=Pedobacter sp. UYP1 TaxID=1756396 RepID=UPI003392BB97